MDGSHCQVESTINSHAAPHCLGWSITTIGIDHERLPLPCRRRAAAVRVQATAQTDTRAAADQVAAIKRDIIALSGKKYGHDLTEASRQQVQAKVKQLEDLQLPVKVQLDQLTGTQWTTVYTTSTGRCFPSAGHMIVLQAKKRLRNLISLLCCNCTETTGTSSL